MFGWVGGGRSPRMRSKVKSGVMGVGEWRALSHILSEESLSCSLKHIFSMGGVSK